MRYDSFWSIQIDKKKYKFLGNFLIFVIFQKGMNGHTMNTRTCNFNMELLSQLYIDCTIVFWYCGQMSSFLCAPHRSDTVGF